MTAWIFASDLRGSRRRATQVCPVYYSPERKNLLMHTLSMAPAERQAAPPADVNELAAKFKALGDPTRLRIYQFLRGQHSPVALDDDGNVRAVVGPTVGEVCCHVTGKERITSTISEHLKELRRAGLVRMERRGKNMICGINPDDLALLGIFFLEEPPSAQACCSPDEGC